ncbi:SPOR domain-containing protein [Vibrio sp.]|uniref:SPOR domain-containing protein n=1 Tax=Vibrio sp. TaxID=678 RepID=UPI003D11854D
MDFNTTLSVTFRWMIRLALTSLVWPLSTAVAQPSQFLCDATQASGTELPVLDKSCLIGNGLWGRKPKNRQSLFWIQCGLLPKPMTLAQAKVIYPHISADVWVKPEPKGYRCLIGPYHSFTQASQELTEVAKLKGYQQAFIREVVGKGQSKPVAKQVTPDKPKAATAKSRPQSAVFRPASPAAHTEITRGEGVIGAGLSSSPATSVDSTDIQVRLSTVIDQVEYKLPYMLFSDSQFYMEYDQPWNRLNYDQALATCQQLNMRLVSQAEWQKLLQSKVMLTDKWPIHLPYWGEDKQGLFSNGKVNQLNGRSLLNVLCARTRS